MFPASTHFVANEDHATINVMENPIHLLNEQRFSQEVEHSYEDGERIFAEGDDGRELYIIQEGSVEIVKNTSVGPVTLARFTKGHFFGDMALLQSIPRNASAYARGPTKLLILQPGGFLLKIRRDPTFAFEMIQQLSERVKFSNDRLIDAITRLKLPKEEVDRVLDIVPPANRVTTPTK